MPRYYKHKIYDEYTRIKVGAYQLTEMQNRKNKAIEQMGLDAYEHQMEQVKYSKYQKQKQSSAKATNNKL